MTAKVIDAFIFSVALCSPLKFPPCRCWWFRCYTISEDESWRASIRIIGVEWTFGVYLTNRPESFNHEH